MDLSLIRDQLTVSSGQKCHACQELVSDCKYSIFYDNKSSRIYKCPNCGMMFTYPTLIDLLSERQMDSIEDAELFGSSMLRKLHENLILSKEVKEIKKLLGGIETPKLLDVGCGTGWATNFWQENGFSVAGLEPSAARGKVAAERYGIKVYPVYIEDFPDSTKHDVLIFRHIIEHLDDPATIITKAKKLLNKDGLVVVVVPNIDCIGRYLFGVDWEWVLPWHCNFFNKHSLETLLEESGFEIIKTYQTVSPFYYFESLARRFDSKLLKAMNRRFKVASMLATSPVAMLGMALGLGDNLTTLARFKE